MLQIVIASDRWLGPYSPAIRPSWVWPGSFIDEGRLEIKAEKLKLRKPIVNLLFTLLLVSDLRVFFLCRLGHIGEPFGR